MFSICIPVYNFDVAELVYCLHLQAIKLGKPFEILLIDDASLVEYRNKNATINLPYFRYIQLFENVGRCKIRNRLAKEAKYPYLIFMDCDSAVPSPDYIANYVSRFEPEIVCCGGRMYENEKPNNEKYLHWKYGNKREILSVSQRMRNPNYGFKTNNFLIYKSLFNIVQFNESLEKYGHEDTLFGIQLLSENKIIKHIDNPLIHIGLEDAEIFLQKIENGVCNLKKIDKILQKSYPKCINYSRLIQTKKRLEKMKLIAIIGMLFFLFKSMIKKNLLGMRPSLFLLDLYKLGLLCSLKS